MLPVSIYALLLFPKAVLGTPDGCARFANSAEPGQKFLFEETKIDPYSLTVEFCTSLCLVKGYNAAGLMNGLYCRKYFTSSL